MGRCHEGALVESSADWSSPSSNTAAFQGYFRRPTSNSCKERLRSLVAGTQTENSTTDINAQGLLTTLLQRMGKLEDTLAEARIHRPSPSPIVGCGKKRNYQEGHAHSQMSTTQIDYATTPVLPINSSSAYKIPAFINNIRVSFLLDTGAAVSLIRKDVWERLTQRNSNS